MNATYPSFTSVCGVKGLSPLSTLDNFDYVEDCVVDSMHHIFIHVVKETMTLWFSEDYAVWIHSCII